MAVYKCDNPPPPGNYGGLQVYTDRGRTIGRIRNTLDGSRVKTAPEFAGTRKHAALLAMASPLASAAYRTLPVGKQRAHYQQLAGRVMQWLRQEKSLEQIQLLLQEAVEAVRTVLKRQRVLALIAQKKKVRKPVWEQLLPVLLPVRANACAFSTGTKRLLVPSWQNTPHLE